MKIEDGCISLIINIKIHIHVFSLLDQNQVSCMDGQKFIKQVAFLD